MRVTHNESMNSASRSLLLASAFLFSLPAFCADDLRIGVGYEFSQGDYGQTIDTKQHSIPMSLSWQQNSWHLQASSTYISSSGPDNLVSIENNVSTSSGNPNQQRHDAGLGDTTLTVRKELDWGANQGIYVDLSSSVRLSTASSSSNILKRDEDYSLVLDAYTVQGRWLPLMSVGYKWLGDGDNFTPRNIWLASLGAQYQLANQCYLGAIADYQQAVTSNSTPLKEAFAYFGCPLSAQWLVSPYVIAGFSDSSVDYGMGVQLVWYPLR